MIPFNKPCYTGNEDQYIQQALGSSRISGSGQFSQQCEAWFERKLDTRRALLTASSTNALEMAALLLNIQPGDEVIMPSFTYVSTANAFALRGAEIVFVDINPETMNIDADLIEQAITDKTKAIVPVHYAGVGCNMDEIMSLADHHQLFVVEDAAQGITSTYRSQYLGTIGHLGTYSFHETKNVTSGGEGGLLLVNDEQLIEQAEMIRDRGTDRRQFRLGKVDEYSWVELGLGCWMSDLQAAYLWGQLEKIEQIQQDRKASWNQYYQSLQKLEKKGLLELPVVPDNCQSNAHIFYLKTKNLEQRNQLIKHLAEQDIMAVFHYVPLHSSAGGKKFGRFVGQDKFTTQESERLIRLPLWYGMKRQTVDKVCQVITEFLLSG